jgi:hypothetical protein
VTSASAQPTPFEAAWSAADQAVQRVCAGQGNFNDLWQLVRSLCELGLAGVVPQVLDAIKIQTPEWLMQRAAVLAEAAKLPQGQLTWKSRASLFAENIAALSANNPGLNDLAQFWDSAQQARYQLLQARDGNLQVVDRQAPIIFAGFVGGLIDHRALERHWTYQRRGYELPRPIAFDGAGYGWVLLRALQSTHRTLHDFSCAIYIIEPDFVSAAILLSLHDLKPWANRLRLFVGPQALDDFQNAMQHRLDWDIPANMVSERISPRPALDLQTTVAGITQARNRFDAVRLIELEAHYGAISLHQWADRFEAAARGGQKLKVVGLTSRYTTVLQYSMAELGEAITAAGHEFILCKEPDDQSANVPELTTISAEKPDLIIMLSRLRSENPRLPRNIPCLTWDQDNLPCMRTPAAREGLNPMTYIAGLGARLGYEELGWPRENCILTLGASATHRYHNRPAAHALLEKHRCTFSYTSNASGTPRSVVEQCRGAYQKSPALLQVFDEIVEHILATSEAGRAWDTAHIQQLLDEHLATARQAITTNNRREMIMQLRGISDRAFRHVALRWVSDYCKRNQKTLRLYGNGWEQHPEFALYAAGFLAPGEDMRALYQATDINLQIIETGFIHSRVLDGLAAGGFFLSRFAPEARDLDHTQAARTAMTRRALETGCVTFSQLDASTDPLIADAWAYARTVIPLGAPNERCRMLDIWAAYPSEEFLFPELDRITFGDEGQFIEMADRYLADADERCALAAGLRQTVLDQFSYDARWRQFVSGIAAGMRQAAQTQTGAVAA